MTATRSASRRRGGGAVLGEERWDGGACDARAALGDERAARGDERAGPAALGDERAGAAALGDERAGGAALGEERADGGGGRSRGTLRSAASTPAGIV